MLSMRAQTDTTSYYADTADIYEIKSSYLNPLIGNIYLSDGYIPLPFWGKPNTKALNAEQKCVYAGANYATNDTKKGDNLRDIIYYSEDVLYAGDIPLPRVNQWPKEMLDWAEGAALVNGVTESPTNQS